MSDENENETGSEGSGLRKQLEDALAKLKEAEDARSAAETRLADTKLETFLSGKKVNPKFARLAKADKVDATDPKALETWLNENADLVGYTAGDPEADPPNTDEPPEEVASAWKNVQTATATGESTQRSKLEAALRSLPDNATPEEVDRKMTEVLG